MTTESTITIGLTLFYFGVYLLSAVYFCYIGFGVLKKALATRILQARGRTYDRRIHPIRFFLGVAFWVIMSLFLWSVVLIFIWLYLK